MKTSIKVVDVKCVGCTNSIHKALGELVGVFGVNVDAEHDVITIEHTDEVTREQLKAKLLSLGYTQNAIIRGFEIV